MLTYFTLPPDFVETLTATISNVFNDFKIFFLVLIGLFIGFFIVSRIIEALTGKKISDEDEE